VNHPVPSPSAYRFGVFEVDLQNRELRKHGIRIRLQAKPFQVLEELLRHPGQLVTRDELRKRLWTPDTFVDFDEGVNTALKRLRTCLGDSAENPLYIETVSRYGYRFIAPVTVMTATEKAVRREEPAPQMVLTKSNNESGKDSHLRTLPKRSLGISLIAATLLFGAIPAYMFFSHGPASRTSIESIAVLPLKNLAEDPSQEYFADGITDEITTQLAKLAGPRVTSGTSAMVYKGTHKTLPEIARELHVDAIVEGSVERSADRVRVHVQLIHGVTDKHIWAQEYERRPNDVLQLETDVAEDIADQVRPRPLTSPGPSNAPLVHRAARSVDFEAHNEYLKGKYYAESFTVTDIVKGISYLESSTKRDPAYAPGFSALAWAYTLLGEFEGAPATAVFSKSQSAAERALALDQNSSETHAVLGTIYNYEWRWEEAEQEFKRAIQLDPNSALAYDAYAFHLAEMGQANAAVDRMNQALNLDLDLHVRRATNSYVFLWAGQFDRAVMEAKRGVEMDPKYANNHLALASALNAAAKPEEAFEEWLKFLNLSGDEELARRQRAALRRISRSGNLRGNPGEITVRYYIEKSKRQYVSPFTIAGAYIDAGDKENALKWLQNAYQAHCPGLVSLKVDPYFDPLRSDPRFQRLIRAMGFPH